MQSAFAERMREMSALCIWKHIGTQPAVRLLVAVMVMVMVGCKDVTSEDNRSVLDTVGRKMPGTNEAGDLPKTNSKGEPVATPNGISPDQIVPKEPIAIPATKPDKIYEPTVVLSRSHEQTCLVNVGDTIPDLALKRLTGESVSLKELRGDNLTVVVFWTHRLAFAREQFQRLASEVALPLRHLDVKVVAVNVGDPVEQIELDAVTKEEVACVLDPDGSAIATVATTKLPRTYLIDGEGRILWFDIEYSRTTRRQLKNAIFYYSREKIAGAS
ncbi:MAG TPA: TlpA disulfide reductase family protein [Pirellulaceae bacterium]|jgi:peroxiredoxin|nr:TlpA disulfide reductase family protein [Pirellulaceae bacterium]